MQPATTPPALPAFRIPSGRERRARSWPLFWKVAILPSLVLVAWLVTAPYWFTLIKALPDLLR